MIVYVVSRTETAGRQSWNFANIDVVTDYKEAERIAHHDFQERYTSDKSLWFEDDGYGITNFGNTEVVVGYDIDEFEVDTGGIAWLDE